MLVLAALPSRNLESCDQRTIVANVNEIISRSTTKGSSLAPPARSLCDLLASPPLAVCDVEVFGRSQSRSQSWASPM